VSDSLRTLIAIAVIHRPPGSRSGQQKSRTADGFNWPHSMPICPLESFEIASVHESAPGPKRRLPQCSGLGRALDDAIAKGTYDVLKLCGGRGAVNQRINLTQGVAPRCPVGNRALRHCLVHLVSVGSVFRDDRRRTRGRSRGLGHCQSRSRYGVSVVNAPNRTTRIRPLTTTVAITIRSKDGHVPPGLLNDSTATVKSTIAS